MCYPRIQKVAIVHAKQRTIAACIFCLETANSLKMVTFQPAVLMSLSIDNTSYTKHSIGLAFNVTLQQYATFKSRCIQNKPVVGMNYQIHSVYTHRAHNLCQTINYISYSTAGVWYKQDYVNRLSPDLKLQQRAVSVFAQKLYSST